MQRPLFAVVGLAFVAGLLAAPSANAGWFHRERDPDAPDRYPYVYEPPRYYPYYNSGDWRPAYEMRRPRPYYQQPAYFPAWGYPVGCETNCEQGPLK